MANYHVTRSYIVNCRKTVICINLKLFTANYWHRYAPNRTIRGRVYTKMAILVFSYLKKLTLGPKNESLNSHSAEAPDPRAKSITETAFPIARLRMTPFPSHSDKVYFSHYMGPLPAFQFQKQKAKSQSGLKNRTYSFFSDLLEIWHVDFALPDKQIAKMKQSRSIIIKVVIMV